MGVDSAFEISNLTPRNVAGNSKEGPPPPQKKFMTTLRIFYSHNQELYEFLDIDYGWQ